MKKIKLLLLLLIILIVTGCNVEYRIIINKDLSVSESGYGVLPNSFFHQKIYSSTELTLNNLYANVPNELFLKNYNYSTYTNLYGGGIRFFKEHISLSSFVENSFIYNQYYEKLNYSIDKNIVKIYTSGEFYDYFEEDQERYAIDSGVISITLPFELIESNADECNNTSKNTTCIWNIKNRNVNKEINIAFDKNKTISNEDNIFYFVIGAIGVIILISVMNFMTILSSRNKF